MKKILEKLIEGRDLSGEEAETAIRQIMSGEASDVEKAALLTALKIKGETPGEIAAFARIMREYATKINPTVDGTLVDMCGTGGDNSGTFNISTTAMFVVAGAGIPVAKHGNRAATSKCGSADVLEQLGCDLEMSPERIERCIEETGIGFMFAQRHHPAMKHVMPVRKQLGFRTVFNILGPLTNPANAKAQVMGVYDADLTEKIAEVFAALGTQKAMIVHGEPGLDEISTVGKTRISELNKGDINTYYIEPEDYGLKRAGIGDLAGGDPKKNATILTGILNGTDKGPKRDVAVLNAAAGIVVGGLASDLKEGVEIAAQTIDDGKAYAKMQEYVDMSNMST